MKNDIVPTLAETTEKSQRLPYTSPTLKTYGQLRELTDGGSGAIQEGMMGTALMRFN